MSVFPSVRQKDRWILQQGLTHRLSGTVLLLRNSSRSEMTVAAQAHPGLAYSWSFIPPPPFWVLTAGLVLALPPASSHLSRSQSSNQAAGVAETQQPPPEVGSWPVNHGS